VKNKIKQVEVAADKNIMPFQLSLTSDLASYMK
jgi:hypothetical protein